MRKEGNRLIVEPVRKGRLLALLDTLGPPDGIYEARHQFADYDAGIPASTYIYTDSFASSGHCVDAYVIDEWTSTVIKYYCR